MGAMQVALLVWFLHAHPWSPHTSGREEEEGSASPQDAVAQCWVIFCLTSSMSLHLGGTQGCSRRGGGSAPFASLRSDPGMIGQG